MQATKMTPERMAEIRANARLVLGKTRKDEEADAEAKANGEEPKRTALVERILRNAGQI